jgi:plastocyanin
MRTFAIVTCGVLLAGCGGGMPSAPSPSATITVSVTGVSPAEVRVKAGATVSFTNSDIRPHSMVSDPVTIHTDCPSLNDVGTLQPGQSRSSGPLTVVRTCGYHDHNNEGDPTWTGRIIVE